VFGGRGGAKGRGSGAGQGGVVAEQGLSSVLFALRGGAGAAEMKVWDEIVPQRVRLG